MNSRTGKRTLGALVAVGLPPASPCPSCVNCLPRDSAFGGVTGSRRTGLTDRFTKSRNPLYPPNFSWSLMNPPGRNACQRSGKCRTRTIGRPRWLPHAVAHSRRFARLLAKRVARRDRILNESMTADHWVAGSSLAGCRAFGPVEVKRTRV
jgi:hypothetical protein